MMGATIFLYGYYGVGYTAFGNRASSGAFRELSLVPGHMHTQGVVMLLTAAALVYGMGCRGHFLRVALAFAWGYSLYVLWSIIFTWIDGHAIQSWGAPAGWVLICYFTWHCWRTIPPHQRRWADRVRQA